MQRKMQLIRDISNDLRYKKDVLDDLKYKKIWTNTQLKRFFKAKLRDKAEQNVSVNNSKLAILQG
jgi:hypothetical protein